MGVRAFSAAIAAGACAIGTLVAQAPATPDVLVSRQLLRDAHLVVGDMVEVASDPEGLRSVRVRIAGVYEPTPDPMKFNVERFETRLHLPDLLALTADPA